MTKTLLSLVFSVAIIPASWAQSTFILRNSTWQDFTIDVVQSGEALVPATEYELINDTVLGWWLEEPVLVFQANRSSATVAAGDVAQFDVRLMGAIDTLVLHMQLTGLAEGGTSMRFALSGPGIATPYSDSPDFQEYTTTLAGKNVIIKFKPDNDDATQQRNVFFTIHDMPIYEIDAADFANPNVMNAMFYNIQMIPFGLSGMGQPNDRGDLLPGQISPYQDVVVFEEVFDDSPREDHLEPAMLAAGFAYRTEILNPSPGIIPLPWNGGVIIFSRWPIEMEADYNFELCGQASQDCLANKGIKYARINKLGKLYHIFGTHMDAGGEADDILAKQTQMGEMRAFIDAQNIPDGEPVIFGGDFNVSPLVSIHNLYPAMLDSINPYIPHPIGYHNSTFDGAFGKIIDNAWGDKAHLVATTSTNEVITMRSIEPVLWQLGAFSDHRCALSRFEFPDITMSGAGDQVRCPGEDIQFEMESDIDVTYQWVKDGQELDGETSSTLSLNNATETQSGQYSCMVSYDVLYGDVADSLTHIFYPNGPDLIASTFEYNFGTTTIDEVLCHVGVQEVSPVAFEINPNPTSGMFSLRLTDAARTGSVEVFNMVGKRLLQQAINGSTTTLDLSNTAAGMYSVRLSANGYVHQERVAVVR
jgi:hypothetical protein